MEILIPLCYIENMDKRTLNGFEQREMAGKAYWADQRWGEVRSLRDQNKQVEANSLVFEIRRDYGVD